MVFKIEFPCSELDVKNDQEWQDSGSVLVLRSCTVHTVVLPRWKQAGLRYQNLYC